MKRVFFYLLTLFFVSACTFDFVKPAFRDDEVYEGKPVTITFSVPGIRIAPSTKSLDGGDGDIGGVPYLDPDKLFLVVCGGQQSIKYVRKAEILRDENDQPLIQQITNDDPEFALLHYPVPEGSTPPESVSLYSFRVQLELSDSKRTIHFLGNIDENQLITGAYSYQILPYLLSYEGKQAYWQKVVTSITTDDTGVNPETGCYSPDAQTINNFKYVPLIRNFADIKITNDAKQFKLHSYAVIFTPKQGTVVPYRHNLPFDSDHPDSRFTFTSDPDYRLSGYEKCTIEDLEMEDRFNYPGNLPSGVSFTTVEDIPSIEEFLNPTISERVILYDRNATHGFYVYEREVPSDTRQPTFIILCGRIMDEDEDENTEIENETFYFYRLDLIDSKSTGVDKSADYYPIYRNFRYDIQLKRVSSVGVTDPVSAYQSTGAEDISADVSMKHLSDISNGQSRLVVEPFMARTFTGPNPNENENYELYVRFFDDVQNPKPNEDPYAVMVTLEPIDGYDDDIVILYNDNGTPVETSFPMSQERNGEKGYRVIPFNLKTAGDQTRTQIIKITGRNSQVQEEYPLYREVEITLQKTQDLHVNCDPLVSPARGTPQTVTISIPDNLPQSMFPLDFIVEAEDMTLTPIPGSDPGNNLPVRPGTSLSGNGKNTFQFIRTLSWSEYSNQAPSGGWRTFNCYFKTNRDDSATTIRVYNEFFNPDAIRFENDEEVKGHFYVQADESEDCIVRIIQGGMEYRRYKWDSDSGEWKPVDDNRDGSQWTSFVSGTDIRVYAGERVAFKYAGDGNVTSWNGGGKFYCRKATTSSTTAKDGKFKLGGNLASLMLGDRFAKEAMDFSGVFTFANLFQNHSGLTDASELVLPMLTLQSNCYNSLFYGCTSLTAAPALRATALATNCYQSMFQGCTSLSVAPALPATTLAANCYQSMFQACTNLTASPVLRADVLANSCYYQMFYGCSKLATLTMIATNISASNCLYRWVSGVAATGDFYGHVKATIPEGVSGIPTGWLKRNEFYVEAVEDGTLSFSGTGLQYSKNWEEWTSDDITSITVAAGDIVRFRGVRSGGTISSTGNFNVAGNILSLAAENYASVTTGTFTGIFKNAEKLVSAGDLVLPSTLQANCFKEMFSGCTSLTTAPALPATDLAENCYEAMFQNCTTLDATPTLPARTLAQDCYKSMFAGCTNLTVSPQLPAETLVDGCYDNMFNGCSNLAKVYCSAKTNLGNGFTTNWLADVAASGLFVKDEAVTTWPQSSPSGIPEGWTTSWSGFKIRAINNTTITFNYTYNSGGIEYSLDEGQTWIHYTAAFTLSAGQEACIKGNRNNYKNDSGDQYGTPGSKPIFTASTLCYISGNIMTLLSDESNLSESAFQGAFSKGTTALTNIDIDPDSPLILPVTTLASKCYMQMFRNCTSLTRAPVFRAEVVNYRSCYNMFRGCSYLLSAEGIELPAMTLAVDCYRELFRDCTKLASAAPALPAPTLVQECYRQMFSNTKITSLICLATDISAKDCTNNWMSGVTNTNARTFYKAPTMSVGVTGGWTRGNSGIPSNWNVEPYSGQ